MHNKKQHFVPATYLRAWCDVHSPPNYDPYVWVFPRNGGEPKHKPPEKIFWETDFYTIKKINGERDLILEHGLAQLESKFTALRDKKLSKHKPLTIQDKSILCTFTAAMYARTKTRRNHLQGQWQEVLDMTERVKEWMKSAPSEQVDSALHKRSNTKLSFSEDDIKYITENTIQTSLTAEVEVIAPALFNMEFAILDTLGISSFITSDNPCIWLNPDEKPNSFGSGSVYSPTIEISLALSPTQCLFFRRGLSVNHLYIPIQVNNPLIEMLNSRTFAFTNEYFIYNKNTFKFSWATEKKA